MSNFNGNDRNHDDFAWEIIAVNPHQFIYEVALPQKMMTGRCQWWPWPAAGLRGRGVVSFEINPPWCEQRDENAQSKLALSIDQIFVGDLNLQRPACRLVLKASQEIIRTDGS